MTFLGWLSDPFKGLSDLQLGDEKGTLNHLVDFFCAISPGVFFDSYGCHPEPKAPGVAEIPKGGSLPVVWSR